MSGQNFVDVLQFVLIVIIARVQIVHFSYIKHLSDVLESLPLPYTAISDFSGRYSN